MSDGSVSASGERSVAAGGDIRQVATGDFATLAEHATVLPPEAFTMGPCTSPVRNVPPRAARFVGRARELALLEQAFGEPGGVVVHAVHGLGGIGKSALAAHWAAGRTTDLNPVWWITAESPTGLDAGLAALGRALQPALVDALSEEAFRERTLQWLAANDGWLLVLDNVSDPADIEPLLARAPGGRFLITSRWGATSWRGIAESLDLDVLELAEAVELFTGIHRGSADGVEELCRELGCLPLAVDQAAAYCREAGIGAREYLRLLAGYPADMYAATAEGGDAQRAVARVWRVTLDQLAGTPECRTILEAIAWWAPDGIPREYLAPLGSPPKITEALRRLAAHSMITLRGGTISVHRLVQAVARTPALGGSEISRRLVETVRGLAVMLLTDAEIVTDEDSDPQATHRVWATHVEALAARSALETDTVEAADLYGSAGLQYAVDGHIARAVSLCERAVDIALRVCGPDHETTRALQSQLADAYDAAGESGRALALSSRVLEDAERTLGPDHPDTFPLRSTMADLLAKSGERERGETLARENAEAAARVLGDDHPDTDEARLTLSTIRRLAESEKFVAGAVEVVERRLADAVAELGEEHPMTATLMMELAVAWRKAGEYGKAVQQIAETEAVCRANYGDTSLLALNARVLHVVILRRAGNDVRADELAAETLADINQSLGDAPFARKLRYALTPEALADNE
ncbi:tetratricopeptide repeat protein [Streptomyces sp. NPDC050535]|uniref:tetratricopeptide repeat protein n=1 Tax=Streptomyces sp. NPDC050535 TaxID=3365626 RepID=UPI0037931665